MKLWASFLVISVPFLIFLGCDSDPKEAEPRVFSPQDLSHLKFENKNGCFRLGNTYDEAAYLYLDVPNVVEILMNSEESLGTSHVLSVTALMYDGRIAPLEDLAVNYSEGSEATHVFEAPESVKALKVFGHSNYPEEGGGRQRVNLEVYSSDLPPNKLAVPQLNCDPDKMSEKEYLALKSAFDRGFPPETVPKDYVPDNQKANP